MITKTFAKTLKLFGKEFPVVFREHVEDKVLHSFSSNLYTVDVTHGSFTARVFIEWDTTDDSTSTFAHIDQTKNWEDLNGSENYYDDGFVDNAFVQCTEEGYEESVEDMIRSLYNA